MGIQNLSGDLLVCFSPKFIDMDSCYDFQKTVLLETAQVPKGRVISYGCLAKRIFAPRAARAIGSALAKNPFPLIIPCHRVVRSDGNPGDFGGGSDMKKFLLQKEGIDLNLAGKIDAEYFIV
jgi:O-6-methylguanine DNA methyltransferase